MMYFYEQKAKKKWSILHKNDFWSIIIFILDFEEIFTKKTINLRINWKHRNKWIK